MSNTFNILSETAFAEKMDKQNALLSVIAANSGGMVPKSFDDIARIVRFGLAPQVFDIGEEIVISKGDNKYRAIVCDFDKESLVDPSKEHSMTLLIKAPVISGLVYDAKEKLLVLPQTMAATTYHFTVPTECNLVDKGKSFHFTTTASHSTGDYFMLDAGFSSSVALAGQTVRIYSSDNTLSESVTLSEGPSGYDLGIADGASSGSNHIEKALGGNNDWSKSAARQYFNSEAASNFWSAKSDFDVKPATYSDLAGFLYGFDEDFIAALALVNKVTSAPDGTDANKITTQDRVFLLSATEIYGGANGSVSEGSAYEYFKKYSALSQPGTGADPIRIVYSGGSAIGNVYLRSPIVTAANAPRDLVHVRSIKNDGGIASSHALAYSTQGKMIVGCVIA